MAWDLSRGDEFDLTRTSAQKLIRGWISAGLVWGFHLGTPCNSFSIARSGGFHPALRSSALPAGLPGLSAADQNRVDLGNLLAKFSASLLELGRRLGIPCTLENPQSSRLWLLPSMVRLGLRAGCSVAVFHFCMFGTPWRKATRLFGFHVNLSILEEYQCHGKRGICQRSLHPHVQLRGRGTGAEFLTKEAQPYPRKLCTVISRCFYNSLASRSSAFILHRLK